MGMFGDPKSSESFMLPDSYYRVHVGDHLQALALPVISFVRLNPDGTPDELPIHETLDYLEERELWLAATVDASTHVIPDILDPNVGYLITHGGTSIFGRVIMGIEQDEAAGSLPQGSLSSARRALINCAFEDHPLYERVQQMMDGPPQESSAAPLEQG